MVGIVFLIFICTLFAYIFNWANNKNKYWEKRGIKCLKPLPFFGNLFSMFCGTKNTSEIINEAYKTYPNELVIGYYELMGPRLIIRSNDLVQKVLIKEFGHFVDHRIKVDEENYPLDDHLFNMTGNKWRTFRSKMTPLFTSGKLKNMFEIMYDVGENFLKYLDKNIDTDIDMYEAMSLFSMDIIGSAGFGIYPGVLNNPESEFRVMGKKLNDTGYNNLIKLLIAGSFPNMAKKLGITFQNVLVNNYFANVMRSTIKYREKNHIQRNDFVKMLLQLKEKGSIRLKKYSDNCSDKELNINSISNTQKIEVTDNILVAQAVAFLTGGFDATAIFLAYSMFEICRHPEVQENIRKDVIEQVKQNGGLTYEALKNMKYLEQAIKETQRLYSFFPCLMRVCTKDYTLPNGYTVEKGEQILIPLSAIHMDPHFYSDPKSFKPERFEDQPKPGTFLAFGDGPRMCIASKYAMLVMKYGLALIHMNYKAKLSPATKLPLKSHNRDLLSIPTGEIFLSIEKIEI